MITQEEIEHQLILLAQHRARLSYQLRRFAVFGIFTPYYMKADIEEAREQIKLIKEGLRQQGIVVPDEPGDQTGLSAIEQRAWWLRLFMSLVVVGIFGILTTNLLGGITGIRTKLDAWGIWLAFPQEQPGETLIVISPFYYTEGNHNVEAHQVIRRQIQDTAVKLGLTHLRVETAPMSIRAEDRVGAEMLGARYHASIIIWGDDTGLVSTVNFLNLHFPKQLAASVTVTETSRSQIADPSGYAHFILKDIPQLEGFLTLFALGQSYISKGDYENAMRVLEQAVSIAPQGQTIEGLDTAYFVLGWFHQINIKDATQAVANYDKAIEQNPTDANIYNNRGISRQILGDLDGAIRDYTQAITLDASLGAAFNNRGIAYYEQENPIQAIADYNHAIALDSQNMKAYFNRGLAHIQVSDLVQALQDFDQVISKNAQDAQAWYSHGTIRQLQMDFSGAIQDFNQTIKLEPEYADAYNNRGRTYLAQNDLSSALKDFDEAIRLKPSLAEAYVNRALVYEAQQKTAPAIADYEQAMKLSNSPQLRQFAEEHLRRLRSL